MTTNKDVKKRIRDRQAKTGEAYSTAHLHVMNERAALLAPDLPTGPARLDAIVLKVNQQSARIRIPGEAGEVTFRSADLFDVVPAHVVTLAIEKRWTWHDDDYASGKVESARIDIPTLGLQPLPLEGGELEDIRDYSEPYEDDEPYGRMWKKLTAKPRPSYEFHEIAWGQLPGLEDAEDNPTCTAAELRELGRVAEARKLLMETLGKDLRVLDAHAGLGNMEFESLPKRALLHYELGIRIGELSLPPDFDGLLTWGRIYNRPFLRCLHGYGLCLWRSKDFAGAQRVFERILSLNPTDNQGVRACWQDVREGRAWEEMNAEEERVHTERRRGRR